MLAVRGEVKRTLKQMGVAPVVSDEAEEEPKYEEPVTQRTSAEIEKLLSTKKKISTKELEDFWEDAAAKQSGVPANPDAITYDQARQLGLTPGEEE
jgi:hypothetical protein